MTVKKTTNKPARNRRYTRPRQAKVTIGQMMAALKKNAGLYSYAAAELGITRQAVRDRVIHSPILQEFLNELDEEMMDRAESGIFKAIDKADEMMCRWFAERKGKKRGYGTKSEVSLSDADLDAIVGAFGGDVEKLRAARASLEN